jgi:hypothetical protein
MALFKMNRTYGLVPEQCEGLVAFTDSAFTAGTVNRQVLTANLTVSATASNNGTLAFLGPDATIKPTRYAQPFTIFCNPNGSAVGAAANTSPLPLGLQNGVTGTLGSEYVIDFSAFASDITAAQAGLVPNARNTAVAQSAFVTAIDNVNKLIYVSVTSTAGALAANNTTNTIFVDIQFTENGFTV